jgi:type II restriction enzyme
LSGSDPPGANLGFEEAGAVYESPSQNARVWTEGWVANSSFCLNCGRPDISKYANNKPAADFACLNCREDYELKSKKGRFGPTIVDGAYSTMMQRLVASDNPNLICMNYDLNARSVTDVFVVPKQFFTPDLIEERPPLGPNARRAGWIGCKIRLDQVPASGKVFVIRERELFSKTDVLEQWRSTLFLRGKGLDARGWLIEVMRCVDEIGQTAFTLEDVYGYEAHLSALYPSNHNVRAKIRQQLQVLRDQGYITFLGRGRYGLARRD